MSFIITALVGFERAQVQLAIVFPDISELYSRLGHPTTVLPVMAIIHTKFGVSIASSQFLLV